MPAFPSQIVQKSPIPSRILVLYASQTGQAESISEYIYTKFISGGLKPVMECLDALPQNNESSVERICVSKFEEKKDFFEMDPMSTANCCYLLIAVASTTGQGDPPDTALKFYRYLKKLQRTCKSLAKGTRPPFSHIQFALLGLGDTNYDNFAQFSKNLNRLFTELGAQTFVDTKYADDAGELETITEPFIEHLTETLLSTYGKEPPANSDKQQTTMESLQSGLESLKIQDSSPPNETRKCSYLNSDEFLELNKQFQSLRGPFEKGDANDYRKMPVQQVNIEDHPTSESPYSLLTFFQNKHKECLVYSAHAQAVPDKVLTETESERCFHQEKVDFNVTVDIPLTSHEIELERPFIPGDSYGIYCMNSINDVLTICKHSTLKLSSKEDDQDVLLYDLLSTQKDSERIGLKHQDKVYELFDFLLYCVDTRTMIKRRDLYLLSQFTFNQEESDALKELSTRKSNKLYETVILSNFITVCDILRLFPGIRINVYRLIAMLNPAKPRYFSLSRPPCLGGGTHPYSILRGTIWVTLKNNFSPLNGRNDENILGQFSGKFFMDNNFSSNADISKQFRANYSSLPALDCSVKRICSHKVPIFIFLRPNTFKISMDSTRPSLFLSAGTGISPFLSYFNAKNRYSKDAKKNDSGKSLLFHGTRNEGLIIEKDTLFEFFGENCLHFAFSRQKTDVTLDKTLQKCAFTLGRVPDSLKRNSKAILELFESAINDKSPKDGHAENDAQVLLPLCIYLCGGKAFQNDVKSVLQQICQESPVLGERFWNDTLSKSIHIDQW